MESSVATSKSAALSKVLTVLLLAQFIIVIDTTFMNVSISTLVADFHTTVTSIQNAITLYALVMAAFMIAGAKFGDIIGRKRAFTLGLFIYGVGTTLTSLSPILSVFIFGWSILEGLGASLMLPAMMSLIVSNFPAGPERTKAYARFAAIAGIAAGIGPIIGGLFTTYLSWRLAFASELIVVIYIFFHLQIIADAPYEGDKPKFDWTGFILSAVGLITMVEGIVLASTYGLFVTRTNFAVGGKVLLSAGQISPTIILVTIGILILLLFIFTESRRLKRGVSTLLNVTILKIKAVSAGAPTQLLMYLAMNGVIFSLSLYVQMVLGYSAILSGLTLLPLSIAVLVSAGLSGTVLSRKYAPRSVIIGGFGLIVLGAIAMGLTARSATSGFDFLFGLAFLGLGVGLVASQNQNLVMSSVDKQLSNETSGLLNTSQNIGSSLGTSLGGAIILGVFVAVATGLIQGNPAFTSSQQTKLENAVKTNAQILSNAQLASATSSLPATEQQAVASINTQARQKSLTVVYYGLGLIGLLGLLTGSRLPRTKPLEDAGKP